MKVRPLGDRVLVEPVEEKEPSYIIVSKPALPEMLMVKECAKLVTGLTEHTVANEIEPPRENLRKE